MKMRGSFAPFAATIAITLVAGAADAGMINTVLLAGTVDHPDFGTVQRARTTTSGQVTALVQRFTLTEDSTVESVSLFGASTNGSSVSVYILSSLGPDATESSINMALLNADVDINPAVGNTIPSIFHTFDVPDTAFAAGEYFLIVTSDDPNGFLWQRVVPTEAVNAGTGGLAVFPSSQNFYNQNFSTLAAPNDTFGFQIEGTVIPAPGSLALMGLSGMLLLLRRRG